MKPKLIKTDSYYFEIDEEGEVKGGGEYYNTYDGKVWTYLKPPCAMPYWGNKETLRVILAHLPINNAPKLDGVPLLPEIPEKTVFSLEEMIGFAKFYIIKKAIPHELDFN
jgi:hypothetical protein